MQAQAPDDLPVASEELAKILPFFDADLVPFTLATQCEPGGVEKCVQAFPDSGRLFVDFVRAFGAEQAVLLTRMTAGMSDGNRLGSAMVDAAAFRWVAAPIRMELGLVDRTNPISVVFRAWGSPEPLPFLNMTFYGTRTASQRLPPVGAGPDFVPVELDGAGTKLGRPFVPLTDLGRDFLTLEQAMTLGEPQLINGPIPHAWAFRAASTHRLMAFGRLTDGRWRVMWVPDDESPTPDFLAGRFVGWVRESVRRSKTGS